VQVPETSAGRTTGTAKQPSVDSIARELETILASHVFARAERSVRFLRFVVEMALAGKRGELKETVIGVYVFGRKPDYNPRVDPIVRMEAAKLRMRLKDYYSNEGSGNPVVIQLPKGGYGPVFRSKDVVSTLPRGTYGIQLTVEDSAGNSASASATITLGEEAPPRISSISPSSPTAKGNQNAQVFGSNFQAGLTVEVFDSSGGLITNQSGTPTAAVVNQNVWYPFAVALTLSRHVGTRVWQAAALLARSRTLLGPVRRLLWPTGTSLWRARTPHVLWYSFAVLIIGVEVLGYRVYLSRGASVASDKDQAISVRRRASNVSGPQLEVLAMPMLASVHSSEALSLATTRQTAAQMKPLSATRQRARRKPHVYSGSEPPFNCSAGDVFHKTNATPGWNTFTCHTKNVWSIARSIDRL
jgi:hypothetical protein